MRNSLKQTVSAALAAILLCHSTTLGQVPPSNQRVGDELVKQRLEIALQVASAPSRIGTSGRLTDPDEVVRYWAALGLTNAGGHTELLRPLLRDSCPSVRAVAAFGVAKSGDDDGLKVLIELLDQPQPAAVTEAMTWLDRLGDRAKPHAARIQKLADGGSEYPKRLAIRMLGRWQTR